MVSSNALNVVDEGSNPSPRAYVISLNGYYEQGEIHNGTHSDISYAIVYTQEYGKWIVVCSLDLWVGHDWPGHPDKILPKWWDMVRNEVNDGQ